MKKSGVIFDMDGLMFDTQRIYDKAFYDLAQRDFGFTVPEEMRLAMMGRSGQDMYDTINSFFPDLDAVEYIRRGFAMVAERVKTELVARPGLYDLLPYLKKEGYRLELSSGSNRAIVESNLETSGLTDYFIGTVCDDEVTLGKPAPEGYLRTAALIGCDPADCYVLEDSINGILAGHNAGCSVIMIPNGVEPDDKIRNICAGIYETLADVKTAMEAGTL